MTARASTSVVTGAFGYTGKYIARRMLDQGSRVRTLTRTPVSRSPFGDRVEVRPPDFGDPPGLVASLEGADILYNTYWVRFATFIPKQGDVLQSQGTWEQTQTGTKSKGCDKQSRSLSGEGQCPLRQGCRMV